MLWNYIIVHWWLWVALAPVKVALAMGVRKGYRRAVESRQRHPDYHTIVELERTELGEVYTQVPSDLSKQIVQARKECQHRLTRKAHDDNGYDYHRVMDKDYNRLSMRKCLKCRQHVMVWKTPTRGRQTRHTILFDDHVTQFHGETHFKHCAPGHYFYM